MPCAFGMSKSSAACICMTERAALKRHAREHRTVRAPGAAPYLHSLCTPSPPPPPLQTLTTTRPGSCTRSTRRTRAWWGTAPRTTPAPRSPAWPPPVSADPCSASNACSLSAELSRMCLRLCYEAAASRLIAAVGTWGGWPSPYQAYRASCASTLLRERLAICCPFLPLARLYPWPAPMSG